MGGVLVDRPLVLWRVVPYGPDGVPIASLVTEHCTLTSALNTVKRHARCLMTRATEVTSTDHVVSIGL